MKENEGKTCNPEESLFWASIYSSNLSDEQKINTFSKLIGLNRENAIVIDYGGKPVGKIRDALKGFPYQANLCAAIINHANSVGKKLQDDIKQIIQKI